MKRNRNSLWKNKKSGKKKQWKGQESSMSLTSGMHCLALPVAGTCSLLLSLNKQCSKSSRRPRPLGQPSAQASLTLTRQRSGPRDKHSTIISTISAALPTSLHPLRYDERDKMACGAKLYGIYVTARLRKGEFRDVSRDKPPVSGHIVPDS